MPPRVVPPGVWLQFEANEDSAFDFDAVEAAFDDSVQPLFPILWTPDPFLEDVPALFG